MKNKLFLTLSLLTAAFSVSAVDSVNHAQVPGRFEQCWKIFKNGAYRAYTTSTEDFVNATIAGTKSAYNLSTTYAVENPYKTAGIVVAMTMGSYGVYKLNQKGYLKNPFAKAKAVNPVITKQPRKAVRPSKKVVRAKRK